MVAENRANVRPVVVTGVKRLDEDDAGTHSVQAFFELRLDLIFRSDALGDRDQLIGAARRVLDEGFDAREFAVARKPALASSQAPYVALLSAEQVQPCGGD